MARIPPTIKETCFMKRNFKSGETRKVRSAGDCHSAAPDDNRRHCTGKPRVRIRFNHSISLSSHIILRACRLSKAIIVPGRCKRMAGATGLESAASCVTRQASIRLNFAPHIYRCSAFFQFPPIPSRTFSFPFPFSGRATKRYNFGVPNLAETRMSPSSRGGNILSWHLSPYLCPLNSSSLMSPRPHNPPGML